MKKGFWFIILSAFLFSTMEIVLKMVSNQFNPIQISFLRFFIGSIMLLPLALKNLRGKKLRLNRNDYSFFILTGFICVVVSMTFYQLAIFYCKASIVAVLFSCNPIFVVTFAFFLIGEKLYKHTIITMGLSIIGMICILNPFNMTISLQGIIFIVISTVTFALYSVISNKKSEKFGGVVLTCFSFLMGSLEMLVLILITKLSFISKILSDNGLKEFANIPILHGITISNIPMLAYISIFVTGLGYTFYILAMEETSASTASIVFFIKPALAPILALIILKEAIATNTMIGIAFIVIGSIINFRENNKLARNTIS
ncbi:DMT family transporter [Clostridium estertheticum]|uniref:DMT family transporter n=1 Tax=Clostridium estertheticum TaxID=238834 RepID=UPI001C7E1782|nr:DMT family transporter [Clostridium estertheticum]MBX4270889.1 DMT family transporter [Clostridium estertheticum]WLC81124.1 DMT family transporter [Clostridium estertheticum]